MVDINKADDYKNSQLFMSEDGSVGFAIKPDGEISSLVKNKKSQKTFFFFIHTIFFWK